MQSGNLSTITTFAENIFMEDQVKKLLIARDLDAEENKDAPTENPTVI